VLLRSRVTEHGELSWRSPQWAAYTPAKSKDPDHDQQVVDSDDTIAVEVLFLCATTLRTGLGRSPVCLIYVRDQGSWGWIRPSEGVEPQSTVLRTYTLPLQMSDSTPKPTFTGLLDLLSNVKVGLVLLFILLVYCAVGSAGIPISVYFWEPATWVQVREHPWFEMTEMEWFQWWPFVLLIGLTCLVMATTTIRKIPLTRINGGVWMVHTGLITLAVGSVVYFSTKVEGDVPVARAIVSFVVPGGEERSMLAMPGNSTAVRGEDGIWSFRITQIDPQWELLSGDDKGTRAYTVTIAVQPPEGYEHGPFMRQLIAGYPQYTEDIIRSGNAHQPMARAKKVLGRALVDETLTATLQPAMAERFYLQAEPALYLRDVIDGIPGAWSERPIHDLPRFNDRVSNIDRVWPAAGERLAAPINIAVPSMQSDDPLAGLDIRITDYLRHASLQTRSLPVDSGPLAPAARVTLATGDGRSATYELFAMDPDSNTAPEDLLTFKYISDEAQLQPVPRIRVTIPGTDIDITASINGLADANPDVSFNAVEGTDFKWRVRRVDDDLKIVNRVLSLAVVEIDDGERVWERWVFDDPTNNGDLTQASAEDGGHQQVVPVDGRIAMTYLPATGGIVPVVLVAGPQDSQLRLLSRLQLVPRLTDLAVGESQRLGEIAQLTVDRYAPRTMTDTRPAITPRAQRDRSTMDRMSMLRVDMPGGGPAWLTMHQYPFDAPELAFSGFSFAPTTVTLDDGRVMQLLYSRASAPIGGTVQLDGFHINAHIGGFTGSVSSVLNWVSDLRFNSGDVTSVSVNDPQQFNGLWFFQSQWDPPDPRGLRTGGVPSAGRNFTVLGVGNRRGVWVMLFGSTWSVLGMMYAFYLKPVLRRRKIEATLKGVRAAA